LHSSYYKLEAYRTFVVRASLLALFFPYKLEAYRTFVVRASLLASFLL